MCEALGLVCAHDLESRSEVYILSTPICQIITSGNICWIVLQDNGKMSGVYAANAMPSTMPVMVYETNPQCGVQVAQQSPMYYQQPPVQQMPPFHQMVQQRQFHQRPMGVAEVSEVKIDKKGDIKIKKPKKMMVEIDESGAMVKVEDEKLPWYDCLGLCTKGE